MSHYDRAKVFLPEQTVCPFCLAPRKGQGKVLVFECGTRIYPTNEVADRRITCFRREIDDLYERLNAAEGIIRAAERAYPTGESYAD